MTTRPSETTEPIAHARRGDPQTSHDAARAATPGTRGGRAVVLSIVREFGPVTDEAIYAWHLIRLEVGLDSQRMSVSGCRTRRGELVKLGLVERVDFDGVTESGNACIRWAAVSDANG